MGEGAHGVRVDGVAPGGPAARAGIGAGDRVLSVDGLPVGDLLDLHFLTSRARFRLRWEDRRGRRREKSFRPSGEPLGIFPEPVRVRRCRNRCLFCFVHQLPPGLRRSLYVKDEDVRLSFLHGQYVTLTDVTDEEMARIVRYRLSPLYVSIHTTDPVLRRRMLGNPRAADVMDAMRRLTGAGISLHGQIVVCPGINDGDELERTLRDLVALRPGLSTVAVVPVGLTAHRHGLFPLRPVTARDAGMTLERIRAFNRRLGRSGTGGETFVQPADEYFLLAGRVVPGRSFYGSFPQTENGVGLLRRFADGARGLFARKRWPGAPSGGTVVSGLSPRKYVAPFLSEFSRRTGRPFLHLPVPNRLMGEGVTVTGLLSGGDILGALAGRRPPRIYIPSVCLREAGDVFLDNLTPADVAREAGAPVTLFDPTPSGFREAVYGVNITTK